MCGLVMVALGGCRAFGERTVSTVPLYEDTWECVETALGSLGYTPSPAERGDRHSLKFYMGVSYIRVEEEMEPDGRLHLALKVGEGYWEAVAYEAGTGEESPSTPPHQLRTAIDLVEAECGLGSGGLGTGAATIVRSTY